MNLIKKRITLDLRDAIINGEYPPGTHLVESELCARFKVSRTPVREALAELEKEGFVRITPASGARVVDSPLKTSPTSTTCSSFWKGLPAAWPATG